MNKAIPRVYKSFIVRTIDGNIVIKLFLDRTSNNHFN